MSSVAEGQSVRDRNRRDKVGPPFKSVRTRLAGTTHGIGNASHAWPVCPDHRLAGLALVNRSFTRPTACPNRCPHITNPRSTMSAHQDASDTVPMDPVPSTFTLVSSSGEDFTVDLNFVDNCEVLREAKPVCSKLDEPIPVTLESAVLKAAIAFYTLYADKPAYDADNDKPFELDQAAYKFFHDLDHSTMTKLIAASTYLNYPRLIDSCAAYVNSRLTTMDPEAMRLFFTNPRQEAVVDAPQPEHCESPPRQTREKRKMDLPAPSEASSSKNPRKTR